MLSGLRVGPKGYPSKPSEPLERNANIDYRILWALMLKFVPISVGNLEKNKSSRYEALHLLLFLHFNTDFTGRLD